MRTAPTNDPRLDRRGVTLATAAVQVRAEGDAQRFAGLAAVFDSRTAIGNPLTWGFYEEIAPGAFTKTLSEGDARMLIDHDTYYVVSRASAGTLQLAQSNRGLTVDSALDTGLTYVSDLVRNLDNGNITGMSFGFYVVKDQWWYEDVELSDGNSTKIEVRQLQEIELVEVSAVTFPAYTDTEAGLRAKRSSVIAEDEVRAAALAYGRRERAVELLEARARWCPGLAAHMPATARTEPTAAPQPAAAAAPADGAPAEDAGPAGDTGTEPGTEPGTETPSTELGTGTTEEPAETTPAGGTDDATDDTGQEPAETTPPTDVERVAARMRYLRTHALIPT